MWPFRRKKRSKTISVQVTVDRNFPSAEFALYNKRYPIIDRHFKLTEQLQNTYTPSSEKAVEKGIRICQEMISISDKVKSAFEEQERNQEKVRKQNGWDEVASCGLPSHVGYKQLAIILEKRGQFDEAIKVAKQAKSQGWNGDWDKRIARCESKLDRKRAAS